MQPYQPISPLRNCDHIRGCMTATIILIKYGDFQCTQSGQLYSVLKRLKPQLDRDLCFVFRHFPQVEQHPRAYIAAETAEAAHTQGKFWEMHDRLFENQNALNDGDLLEHAISLDLNIPQFLQEVTDHVHSNRIQTDIANAQKCGIQKTPSVFILIQPSSEANLAEIILKLLEIAT